MRAILIIILMVVFSACEKKADPSTSSGNNTSIIQSCKTTSSYLYDGDGNETQHSTWYYSNGRLDSICSFGPNKIFAVRYEYISSAERKSTQFSYQSGTPVPGYNIDFLDSKGNVIESKSYNNSGKLIGRVTTNYKCE